MSFGTRGSHYEISGMCKKKIVNFVYGSGMFDLKKKCNKASIELV